MLYNNRVLDRNNNDQDTSPQQFSLAHGPNGLSAIHPIRNPSLKDDLQPHQLPPSDLQTLTNNNPLALRPPSLSPAAALA